MRLRRALCFVLVAAVVADRTPTAVVQEANRLLAEGSYLEAARAYTEAIGELPIVLHGQAARTDTS